MVKDMIMKQIEKKIYESPSAVIDCITIDRAVCSASVYTEDYDTPEDFVW